ncbi:hypothetical protein TRIUR3_27668 [Triticum urartu]|uniref:Uncharacterized protein n=1 Tax=Triticum urartu TaxID=4572 RepID=M8A060_TRIUA|nr:hypothetical protein TRIUR3_27668 [Triticum urartu]
MRALERVYIGGRQRSLEPDEAEATARDLARGDGLQGVGDGRRTVKQDGDGTDRNLAAVGLDLDGGIERRGRIWGAEASIHGDGAPSRGHGKALVRPEE